MPEAKLRRDVSLGALTAYGIGGMLGGGIYALVGPVVGAAGDFAWLSFAIAMVVAAPTAITYAALGSRYPKSGGESHYVQRAFGRPRVAVVIGWLVALSGLVSMATLSVAFAGYVQALVPGTPTKPVVAAFLVGLCAINLRGIRLTSGVNIFCTVAEVAGLVLVIVAGAAFVGGGGSPAPAEATGAATAVGAMGVIQGAMLAFYAFIGFEDMVNIAEEVKNPRRAYRIAIPLALVVISVVYIAVTSLATGTAPVSVLADSSAPLEEVVTRGLPWLPADLFDVIALFAVANSALLGCVMASRLLYGMGRDGLLPGWFAAVNARWSTPHRTIAVVLVVSVALGTTGTLSFLAGTTSMLLLLVYTVINVAAFVLLGREPEVKGDALTVPRALPIVGVVLTVAMMFATTVDSLVVAAAALAVGGALAFARRPEV